MRLPESICINKSVVVQKIELQHLSWVYKNIPAQILGEVYSNHGSFEKFTQEFQWTTNYFILDLDGLIFGMIRIIPELNNIVSIHGMGWPNNSRFSRNYLTAWVAMTQMLLQQYPYLHSNCRSNNTVAFRILEHTGFQFTHFGFHEDTQQRSLFFKIDFNDFKNSELSKIIKLNTIKESKPLVINLLNSKPKSQASLKKLNIQFNKISKIHSAYLLPFRELLMNQSWYELKIGDKQIEIITLHFSDFQQHHISPVSGLTFSEWFQIRAVLIENIKIEPEDLLFVYTKDPTLLLNCFADQLVPMGFNLCKERSVWRI
jgi:hypothetical protein